MQQLSLVPTPPQRDLVRFLLRRDVRRCIACWQMGLGKTVLAILFCETNLHYRYPGQEDEIIPQYCVIVASPTIQQNFRENLKQFGKNEAHIARWYRFWSYDLVASRPQEFRKLVTNNIVVCDEIQDIRSVIVCSDEMNTTNENGTTEVTFQGKRVRTGVQAASLLWGIEYAYKALGLTGTIIYNSLSDLYNMGWFLLTGGTEESKSEYVQAMSMKTLKNNECTTEALDAFQRVFQGKFSYCTIESCGLSHKFPKVQEINVLMEMNSEYYHAYSLIENNEIEKLHAKNETKLTTSGAFWSCLRQGANKINSVQSQKVQFILEIVRASKSRGEKIAITSAFLSRGLGLLIHEFRKHKLVFVEISGGIKPDARQTAIRQFNNKTSGVDIIILSGAGTTGINLAVARRQINMESMWNTATRLQTNARIARFGSLLPQVTIYNLMMIKPDKAFESFSSHMRQLIHDRAPGAPSDFIELRCAREKTGASKQTENEHRGAKLELSIDAHLFLKQLEKSRAFQPFFDHHLPSWSVERHPSWKTMLNGCVSIESFLKKQGKREGERRENGRKENTPVKSKHTKQKQREQQLVSTWAKEFGLKKTKTKNDRKETKKGKDQKEAPPSSSSSSSSSSSISASSNHKQQQQQQQRQQQQSSTKIAFDRRQWLADMDFIS